MGMKRESKERDRIAYRGLHVAKDSGIGWGVD